MKLKSLIRSNPLIQILSKDKLVKSTILNNLGIQAYRMKKATAKYKNRQWNTPPHVAVAVEQVLKNGYTQIDNFVDISEFDSLAIECRRLKEENKWQTITEMGPNSIKNIDLKSIDVKTYPAINKFINDQRIHNMFEGLERRKLDFNQREVVVLLQYLEQGYEEIHDPESDLHSDTFFNTHKGWLYIDDVNLENGPFVYVPGSNHADSVYRIDKEKQYSKVKNAKGSRRIPQSELEEQGFKEKIFTCNKNTFLAANTLGYHRRLNGKGGYDRLTIAFSVRFNPFF